MKKIAIILPFMPIPAVKGGAVEQLIQALINENEKNPRYEFVVISVFDEEAKVESLKYKYSNFHYLKKKSLLYKIKNFPRKLMNIIYPKIPVLYVKECIKILKKEKCDFIVIEVAREIFPAIYNNFLDTPVFVHFHSATLDNYKHKLYLYENVKGIFAVSNYVKSQLLFQLGLNEDKKEKIHIMKNCIDCSYINHNEKKQGTSEIIKLIFVGRIIDIKGIKELVSVFNLLSEKIENITLDIYGAKLFGYNSKDKFEQEIMMMCKQNKKIKLLGYVPNEKIMQSLNDYDIAVVPSKWDEPAGMVAMEFYAAGLTVIVTNSGGISEYVSGENVYEIKKESLISELYDMLFDIIINKKFKKYNNFKFVEKYRNENYINLFADGIARFTNKKNT